MLCGQEIHYGNTAPPEMSGANGLLLEERNAKTMPGIGCARDRGEKQSRLGTRLIHALVYLRMREVFPD
jgi:hypothetical protein